MLDSSKPYFPRAYRIVLSLFRILKSKSLRINMGNGYFEVPMKKFCQSHALDSLPIEYSGDIELRSIGWIRNFESPMWSIRSEIPCSFTLLSVINEIKTKD